MSAFQSSCLYFDWIMPKRSGNCTVLRTLLLARHEVVWVCLFVSLLSHFGVRSRRISNSPFSSLYQYCQVSVSPRQVRARGVPVGQQAFSDEFHIGVNCKGRWTSWGFPLEYAFCSKKLLQAGANATSRFHWCLQRGEICQSCLRSASSWMSYCILMQILPAFKNSSAGLEQL